MSTYRSKPSTCEAYEWYPGTGPAGAQIVSFTEDGTFSGCGQLWVEASQSWCDIFAGDFIITEPDGSGFYPCKRKIFMDRWELA